MSLVIILFLFHFRSALIPILSLPIAVLLAFIPMSAQGLTANIMSLGGIAVAIGAMVDAAIIMVENVHKRLEHWEAPGRPGPRVAGRDLAALQEVGRPIFFALLVITVSFLPIFTLEAGGAAVQAAGLHQDVLDGLRRAARHHAHAGARPAPDPRAASAPSARIRSTHKLVTWYVPIVRWVVRNRRKVILGAAVLVLSAVPVFFSLGSEFMPPLNEGTILYMPTAPPGISDRQASEVLQNMDRRLREFPEVETVFGKIGRARTATDPAPLSMVETVITLKPEIRVAARNDLGKADHRDGRGLRYPGMPNIWWMPIQTRHRDAGHRRAQ